MGEERVRCTTCYNVFNTTKATGENVICPMCDSSFIIKKTNLLGDVREQITKLTKEIKEKVTGVDEEVYEIIDGKKYDKELLRLANELGKKGEEIDLEGSKRLFTKINDYNDYTQVEKLTVAYIRKNYKFTVEANQWLRAEIRTKATTRVRDKQTKDPTSSKFQKKTVFTNLKDAYNWDKINSLSEEPKSPAQWAGIILSVVFVLGIMSGIAYGIKWNNQESQWDNDGLSSVQGTVIDINGEGLEGVLIEAEDKKTYTNAQGKYWLYDLDGEEVRIIFELDGYGTVSAWINLRAGGDNILEVEMSEEGKQVNLDYRKTVAEPWPPTYALAPIFMLSAIITLLGSSSALLLQSFRMSVIGCIFGILSYGFLIGSFLSIVALALILVDRETFEKK